MDRNTFQCWLDAYGRKWIERNPQAAAALYASDGTYQAIPFQETLRGRKPTIVAAAMSVFRVYMDRRDEQAAPAG